MTTYVWRESQFVDKRTGEPMEVPKRKGVVTLGAIIPDIPDYISPVTGERVSGRVQRREDLKRNNCIEIDPPKDRAVRKEKYAKALGLPLMGRDI